VQIQYYPATYYVSELDTVAYPLFTTGGSGVSTELTATPAPDGKKLKEVKISTAKNYPKISKAREDCTGAVGASDGCSGAAEMQNFANWFQYYRKRHLMLNAGLGNSLSGVKNLRAGYFLFNNRANATMYDFNNADVSKSALAFLGNAYKTKGNGGTPTRASLDFLGQQFKRTDTDASGKYNVIQAACQYNAGFVITDGFATDTVTITPSNYDAETPSTTYPYGAQYSPSQTGTVNTGSTAPYKDSYNNTLGDVAMKYYTENPRTDLTTGKVTIDENDAGPDADRNRNLHMNTYAIGLGVKGGIFGVNTAATTNPYTTTFSWTTDPTTVTRHPSSVDDLWHATINGRGTMFSANSPEEVRNGLQDVINSVIAKGNGNAAVSVSNSNPTPGDNFTYFSTYNAGSWAGELNARTINLSTGDLGLQGTWNNPGKLLASMTDPLNQRYVATYDATANKGVAFSWGTSGINTTQKTQLGNDVDVLTFLRGDRSDEGVKFRSRGARPPFASGFSGPNSRFPLGHIQSQGRTHGVMAKVVGDTIIPGIPLGAYDAWVSRGVDWLAMSEDLPTPDNRVTIDAQGRIRLHYEPNNITAHQQLVDETRRILRRLGFWKVMTHSHQARNTTHQCGTLCFGTDPTTSVLDPFCRAHDVENLFVVDASFFPSSAAVNPSLTIVAQALRVADHLIDTELGQ